MLLHEFGNTLDIGGEFPHERMRWVNRLLLSGGRFRKDSGCLVLNRITPARTRNSCRGIVASVYAEGAWDCLLRWS
jgi:hypothetical protein